MLSDMNSAYVLVSPFILLCLWGALFQESFAELRFCIPKFGPQRMKDTDCPGGFVFNSAVETDCKYYAKTGNHNGKVLVAPKDCNDEGEQIIEDEGDDLSDISTLTYFQWEEYATANETRGSFPGKTCEDECLQDWEDPNVIVDEEPFEDDFKTSALPATELEELKKMSREMARRLMMDDDDEEDHSRQTISPSNTTQNAVKEDADMKAPLEKNNTFRFSPSPQIKQKIVARTSKVGSLLDRAIHDASILNVVKILSKSMRIALDACAPFIPQDFAEQVLKGMIYISQKVEHTFLDLDSDLYKGISRTLDHCGLRRNQEFKLNGSMCGDKSVVKGIYFTSSGQYWPHSLGGWSFRWGRWHPLLEAAWGIIDFIHSFCFESFMQNLMLLHVFETSLEGLFPEKIQNMWRVNMVMNNDKFWNNLMQTYDLNITMRNLDACQEGARRISPYEHSLPRPFLTLEELRKSNDSSTTTPLKKGWNKTLNMYWDRYEKLGGFQAVSEDFGKCFVEADLEEEQNMIETLKNKCL